MMNFYDLFELAMDRNIGRLQEEKAGLYLNLGAGKKVIPNTRTLDYPYWDADTEPIPEDTGSVRGIYAFHFLEHCKEPVKVLQECQRVLIKGGLLNICVPYGGSDIAFQDLDHKHFFTEETWKTLFKNKYYNKNQIEWKFDIGFNLICGIAHRNLVLLTQLIKR